MIAQEALDEVVRRLRKKLNGGRAVSDTPRTDKAVNGCRFVAGTTAWKVRQASVALETELNKARKDNACLRVRVAQLEGVGEMWKEAERKLARLQASYDKAH